jgi:hypothetical protein
MSAGDNYLKWKHRAEQAEILAEQRKGGITQLTAQLNEALARAERAEADNAALLGALQDSRDPHSSGDCDTRTCHCGLLETMDKNHPGAALLERLHVATAYAATGLREHHGHRCGMAGGPHPDNPRECNDAHCRQWAHDLDAMKERKP